MSFQQRLWISIHWDLSSHHRDFWKSVWSYLIKNWSNKEGTTRLNIPPTTLPTVRPPSCFRDPVLRCVPSLYLRYLRPVGYKHVYIWRWCEVIITAADHHFPMLYWLLTLTMSVISRSLLYDIVTLTFSVAPFVLACCSSSFTDPMFTDVGEGNFRRCEDGHSSTWL